LETCLESAYDFVWRPTFRSFLVAVYTKSFTLSSSQLLITATKTPPDRRSNKVFTSHHVLDMAVNDAFIPANFRFRTLLLS